jgi:hypothetical protein
MRYCQDLLSRDMVAGEHEHQLKDEDFHPYVFSQMKNGCSEYKQSKRSPIADFCIA